MAPGSARGIVQKRTIDSPGGRIRIVWSMPPLPKTPLRCLVADDEPQIGSLLRDALAPTGYAADVVQDGEAASRKLAEQDYALLISDVMMPRKSGVELVREL